MPRTKKQKFPLPDDRSGGSRDGGHLAEIPKPHLRMFRRGGKLKRRATISVVKYYGIGSHYWVTVYEENNPIWDSSTGSWTHPWDDDNKKYRGWSAHKQCNTIEDAERFIEETKKKHPNNEFVDNSDMKLHKEKIAQWHYKDGD